MATPHCGFVESRRSHPTRNAANWRKTSVCRRSESQAVGAASTGQRARPVPLDLLCSRSATSRRSARSPRLRGTRNSGSAPVPGEGLPTTNVLLRRTLAEGLASVSTSVSISGPEGTNRPCLRPIVGTDRRNHNPRVGGSSPSSGIVVNTLISSVHRAFSRSRALAA
jgi:hypothetical protein